MKLSQRQNTGPAVEAVMRFVDDEIARIVADISAHRPPRPAPKPRAYTKAAHAKAA